MTNLQIPNQVLALAGVYQACDQVKKIAWSGQHTEADLETAVTSIFKIDSVSAEDIYGNVQHLHNGLNLLADELDPDTSSFDKEITTYVMTLLTLYKKLLKRADLVQILKLGIEKAETQRQHYGLSHTNTFAALADIYQKTISVLAPRIMVNGERVYLANSDNADKIRTLLLAGIRSAVLWDQCGGTRWSLLFRRRNYYLEARNLLARKT